MIIIFVQANLIIVKQNNLHFNKIFSILLLILQTIMNKIINISIVLSFAGLWVTSMFSGDFEIALGFILIFTFGILHGSNDILLIGSISNTKVRQPFFRVLGIYLLTVGLAVVTFYFLPTLALSLFIIFSAYHFGEQHWEHQQLQLSASFSKFFYLIYGMLVLTLLFVLNPDDVIEVVEAITTVSLTFDQLLYAFLGTLIVFGLTVVSVLINHKAHQRIILKELFLLLVLVIIFKVSTLIWAFTIYFIFWHSIPSLFEQVQFIYGKFDKPSFFKYCKNAFPYWMISLVGIAIVYFLFKDNTIFYALFFSFIAAVTFPHALVITRMFSNKKTQPNE